MAGTDPLAPGRAEELAALDPAKLAEEIEALVAAGAEAAPLLRRIGAVAESKLARKLARRALHRLRSRGVELEPAPRLGGRTVLRPLADATEVGAVSPPDARGHRMLFLVVPVPGAARLYEVAVSDVEGVLALRSLEGRRRNARSALRELRRGSKGLASVSGSEVRALVARARELGVPQHGSVDARALAELVSGAGVTPGERVRAELGSGGIDPARAAAVLRDRAERGVLAPWLVDGEAVAALVRELDALDRSPLVLTEIQKRERRAQAIAAGASEVFDARVRERLAARLEETAALLHAGAIGDGVDEEGARAALEAAARLRDAPDPLAVDFARRCLEASLEAARERVGRDDAGRLVLPP